MLIARSPVRVSLAGGGTDFEAFYQRHGGCVISTSIDKYFYVFVTPSRFDGVQVSSSDYRTFYQRRHGKTALWDSNLDLVDAVLQELQVHSGCAVFLASEVPPGTGLGSSSAVAVGLIKALAAFQGRSLSRAEVAELACTIEIERLGSPIGKQDQYAAAFGGLNVINFTAEGTLVEPLRLAPEIRAELEQNLLLFFVGSSRSANAILSRQREAASQNSGDAVDTLHSIKALAIDAKQLLLQGRLREFGTLLDASWREKRGLAPGISNRQIDELYDLARRKGALGGKITGAGGGGFLLLYCEPPAQAQVSEALEAQGLFHLDYRFESGGAMVLMNTGAGISTRPGSPVALGA